MTVEEPWFAPQDARGKVESALPSGRDDARGPTGLESVPARLTCQPSWARRAID